MRRDRSDGDWLIGAIVLVMFCVGAGGFLLQRKIALQRQRAVMEEVRAAEAAAVQALEAKRAAEAARENGTDDNDDTPTDNDGEPLDGPNDDDSAQPDS